MRWLATGLVLVALAGCAQEAATPGSVSTNVRLRFLDDHGTAPLANVSLEVVAIRCSTLDGLAIVLSFGVFDCPTFPVDGRTDASGWWNRTLTDVDALWVRPADHAGQYLANLTVPQSVRVLKASRTQAADLTADPGIWAQSFTQVTPAYQVAVPFMVDADAGVNQAYLDDMSSFTVRIEWTNTAEGMAMLTAAYGNNGRVVNGYGVGTQDPYALGPQAHEVSEATRGEDWAGFVVGFQTGWPVMGTQGIPVALQATYTFGAPPPP